MKKLNKKTKANPKDAKGRVFGRGRASEAWMAAMSFTLPMDRVGGAVCMPRELPELCRNEMSASGGQNLRPKYEK